MTNDFAKLIRKRREHGQAMLRGKVIWERFKKQPMLHFALFAVFLIVIQVLRLVGGDAFMSSSAIDAFATTLIYCVVSLGFCLLLGYSALASLGTAGFFAIGAYSVYYVMVEWGSLIGVSFLFAIVLAVVIGVIVGSISLRIEGIYLAIVTLGVSQIIKEIFASINGSVQISYKDITLFGIPSMRLSFSDIFFMIVGILFILIIITHHLMKSPTGRAMLAMKNSTSAAQAYGISLMKYRLFAFAISTIYAAIGGALYMLYVRSADTQISTLFSISTSLNILGAVVIGGTKSIWGTIGGTFMIYGINDIWLMRYDFFKTHSEYITLVTGILVILVVMFYPGGLVQLVQTLIYKIKSLFAKLKIRRYGVEN